MAAPLTLPPELQGPAPDKRSPKTVPLREVAPPQKLARPAKLQKRHHWVGASFVIGVALPAAVVAFYLYIVALPQFTSTVGFSIRDESGSTTVDLLGGLSDLSGSASKDADMLYAYLQSQQIVRQIETTVDFIGTWSVPQDPVFGLRRAPTIEDKHAYWNRMVRISYDTNAGLIEVRVHAFRAADATLITQQILQKSHDITNMLADVARSDAVHLAHNNLQAAQATLTASRQRLSQFRQDHRLLDPKADIDGRLGLLQSLQMQKAQALIDFDLLASSQMRRGDPSLELAQRRISVIEDLIVQERAKRGGPEDAAFAGLMAEFEALNIDLEFAQTAYVATRAQLETAKADAARTQKYLAVHIEPTRAERAEYPQRFILLSVITAALSLIWSIAILIYYSIRDRR